MDGRLLGTILWINTTKGYGELQDSFGHKHFFLLTDCKAKLVTLKPGANVTFERSKEILFGKLRVGDIHLLTDSASQHKPQKNRRSEAGV